MSIGRFREWSQSTSSNLTSTSAIVFETKYTDFDNPYAKKSIEKIILNLLEDGGTSSIISIQVLFRTSLGDPFVSYASSFINSLSSSGNRIEIGKLITGIDGVQFQFRIQCANSNFGINDINIVYREYRSVNSSKLSGE
jgi:hypothetical protein